VDRRTSEARGTWAPCDERGDGARAFGIFGFENADERLAFVARSEKPIGATGDVYSYKPTDTDASPDTLGTCPLVSIGVGIKLFEHVGSGAHFDQSSCDGDDARRTAGGFSCVTADVSDPSCGLSEGGDRVGDMFGAFL